MSRRVVAARGLLPVLAVIPLALLRPAPLPTFDQGIYDRFVRVAPVRTPSERVVIVDVDERSLNEMGQWPWPRDRIGQLVAALRDRGAAVVGLDIIFAEADRAPRLADGTTPDAALARALRQGGVIVGHAFQFEQDTSVRRACKLHPVSPAIIHEPGTEVVAPFFEATGAVCNLPLLSGSADASGFLNAAPDPDGILRRVPLIVAFEERLFPSLALAAVMAADDVGLSAVRVVTDQSASLMLTDGREVPLDAKGNVLLRYRGRKRTFAYVSAVDVLRGTAPADLIRNRVAFVGTTALGTREVVATPLDTLFAGVEVQATIADNLLQGDVFTRHRYADLYESLLVFVGAGAVALFMARTGLVAAALCGIGFVAAVWLTTASLFAWTGAFLSPLLPSLGALSAVGGMAWTRVALERRRADRLGRHTATARRFMVQSLLSLVESRHGETGLHSRRTQALTKLLAQALATEPGYRAALTPDRVELLAALAPLHDIGKVSMPDHLLNKPGPFTDEERAQMKLHPARGRDVIERAEAEVGIRDDVILQLAKEIVYTHHERWDGTGYPEGVRGADIPVAGRIMAIVDVYDATANRINAYNRAYSHEESLALIVAGSGTQFDPVAVEAFRRVASAFKAASQVHTEST